MHESSRNGDIEPSIARLRRNACTGRADSDMVFIVSDYTGFTLAPAEYYVGNEADLLKKLSADERR